MKALEVYSLPSMPPMNVAELINRFPQFVAFCVQYHGWALSEDALEQLQERIDAPSFRAVLKAQSKHFYS